MEFIKDQEKRILLSALSREKKVIKEHEELAELIPVINQLDYYFMYDRLFKQIYNQALEDISEKIKWQYKNYKSMPSIHLFLEIVEQLKEKND